MSSIAPLKEDNDVDEVVELETEELLSSFDIEVLHGVCLVNSMTLYGRCSFI